MPTYVSLGDRNQNRTPVALRPAIAQEPHAAAHLLIARDHGRCSGAGIGVTAVTPKSVSQQPILFPRKNHCPMRAPFGSSAQHSLTFPSALHDSPMTFDHFSMFVVRRMYRPAVRRIAAVHVRCIVVIQVHCIAPVRRSSRPSHRSQ